MNKSIFTFFIFCISNLLYGQSAIVIDHRHTHLLTIPDQYIEAAKSNLKIAYFKRSHGSQVDTGGMNAIRSYSTEYGNKFKYSKTGGSGTLMLQIPYASLDFENDVWVQMTKDFLDDPANSQINMVMWAWSSRFYRYSANQYVTDMETLIGEYGPGGSKNRPVPVTFVFQTACSKGEYVTVENNVTIYPNQLTYQGNMIIRNHCITHNRILFDFNDIECWDPDGKYFGDGNPDGSYTSARLLSDDISYVSSTPGGSFYPNRRNWGNDWKAANPNAEITKMSATNICINCYHSMGLNVNDADKDDSRLHCVLKGIAAWWLFAVLSGWDEGISGSDNQNMAEIFDLKNYPNPFNSNTIIEYTLQNPAKVKLELWNSQGQLIKVLVHSNQNMGTHQVPVSLSNNQGVYFYTLEINGQRTSKKMIKL